MEEREAIRKILREHPAGARKLAELTERGFIRSAEELRPGDPLVIVGGNSVLITGSRRYLCSRCGDFIWLAPSGQEFMAKLTSTPILACVACALRIAKEQENPQ